MKYEAIIQRFSDIFTGLGITLTWFNNRRESLFLFAHKVIIHCGITPLVSAAENTCKAVTRMKDDGVSQYILKLRFSRKYPEQLAIS